MAVGGQGLGTEALGCWCTATVVDARATLDGCLSGAIHHSIDVASVERSTAVLEILVVIASLWSEKRRTMRD